MPADEENPAAAQENDDKKDHENCETTKTTTTTNSPTTANNAATTLRRLRTDYPPATSNVWNKKEEEETSVAARASLNLVSVGAASRGHVDRSFDDIELNSLQTSSDCMAKLTCPVRPAATAATSLAAEDATSTAEAELTPRTRRRLFKSTAV